MKLDENHPYAATRAQVRRPPNEGGGYASLTTAQKWEWHADTYAFRRVLLDLPLADHTSPCDQNGEWYDDIRVGVCERYWRRRMNRPKREPIGDPGAEDVADAARIKARAFRQLAAHAMPRDRATHYDTATSLGVTKIERTYTAEQMRAARSQIGMAEDVA